MDHFYFPRNTTTMKQYYVYILASKRNGTLYTGVTDNLKKRVTQHKEKVVEGFTKKYEVDRLVYFEQTSDLYVARKREIQLKKWRRQWKIELTEKTNPAWRDLYEEL